MRTCLDCNNYSMDGGKEGGRMSFDFCIKKREILATAAFCFDDVCCSFGSYFNIRAFVRLEKIAEDCVDYEKTRR